MGTGRGVEEGDWVGVRSFLRARRFEPGMMAVGFGLRGRRRRRLSVEGWGRDAGEACCQGRPTLVGKAKVGGEGDEDQTDAA